ncbi:MAG: SDR family NAD(P)-dependent oxidoreductase [Bacteroidales bacterium]|nr:SDR family NAD(P)-dependent oxidoreductase [Bacteroidales bacterium]MCF8390581.1 SDR family NAD(P)-dependent oxidoreductase [Bacteroidales bacterium]
MKKIVLITGATAGIGEAIAKILAKNNFKLILTGRRLDRLEELKKSLKNETDVLCLNFDIRSQSEVENAILSLPEEWENIDVLINNAGLAVGLSHINDGVIDDWERMIDTNIKGLLYITRSVSPIMVKKKQGHIINIASIAGKEVYENGNVYSATKHAVDALSKAMRIDFVHDGIKVTNIAPGMVDTEFSLVRFKGDQGRADNVYSGLTPLYGEDIAEVVLFALQRPAHVNLNDIVIMPTAQATATIVHRN